MRLGIPLTSCTVVLLALAACARTNPEEQPLSQPAPPPAAVLSPALDSLPLDAKLARMQKLLDDALAAGPMESAGRTNIFAAEVISDRLLEVPPPFAWLRNAYGTEARLRQMQSLADRIVAELRREDTTEEAVVTDVRRLRQEIARLRGALAKGGTAAPPSMDSLLATIPIQHSATGAQGVVE